MEFSIAPNILQSAVSKIKAALTNPSFIKIKASKSLILASMSDGFSIVVKIKNFKSVKEGVVALDFETFAQSCKGSSEIKLSADENQLHYRSGNYKASINLLEEDVSFEHKVSDKFIELDSDSTTIFDFLDVLTLKDIKFKQDDAPISIELDSKSKLLELACASHSEAVLIEQKLKSKSNLSTSLSPKVLKKIKSVVGKEKYKLSLTESSLTLEFEDKNFSISLVCPVPETEVTGIENVKYFRSSEVEKCLARITINSKDLSDYFSKIKTIYEPNNIIKASVSKKGLSLKYVTSKGSIEDCLDKAFKKVKPYEKSFSLDYDLLFNNVNKLKDKITLYFCDRLLVIEIESTEIKFFVMVALL